MQRRLLWALRPSSLLSTPCLLWTLASYRSPPALDQTSAAPGGGQRWPSMYARDLHLELGLYSDQSRKGRQGRACTGVP